MAAAHPTAAARIAVLPDILSTTTDPFSAVLPFSALPLA
jgi:hypothetical protein